MMGKKQLDSVGNFNSEQDEKLFRKIYNVVEEAYAGGVDSSEIYSALHDPVLFDRTTYFRDTCLPVVGDQNKFQSYTSLVFNLLVSSVKSFRCLLKLVVKVVVRCLLIALILTVVGGAVCINVGFNPLLLFPSLAERQCLIPAHQLLLEMVRPIENCSICQRDNETDSVIIEFPGTPTRQEFAKFAYSSKPIIVRRFSEATGNMPQDFNFARLKSIFESEPKGVDTVSEECQFLPFRSPFGSLREAFDLISDNAKWDQPWYIGWSNCNPGVAAKLRKLFPRPKFLPADSEFSAIDWIFIGTPGLGAAMHIDYVRRPSWQLQLSGKKQWTLKPPPECEGECTDDIAFTINPGDMLLVDTNIWFHETLILGDDLSISIGSEYD